jgi:predicted ATPase/class 3 adenylate cyclase
LTAHPTGTVTFLFTDIENSTRLAREYPETWEAARARHHAILREAIELHNGFVFQIIGDAFCVAFHTARDGLNAAVESQRGLQTEEWGESVVKVRMGLHTGSGELHGTEYRGYLTMAKVQRIMSVAYGGQVLLSNTSAELLHNELTRGITLRDMQEHWLKGLPDPERLWQMIAPDLQQDFPPLQSLKENPNNLPVQVTSFIGRDKEVEQIKKRLEKNHLVTLTGSGGVGKTRLSIQVASQLLNEYPRGVWLVELAPVADPAVVTQTVCAALDITPQGSTPALKVLTDYLRPKKILLVVDNCEHLIDASAQLCDALLHACPHLRILASSREALGIEGEHAYRVPSLSLPHPKDEFQMIEESEAVQLFVERAKGVLSEFEITGTNGPVVAQICRRLDGIALAIELAASRVRMLKVEQITSRLDDAFRLLTGGSRTALPRQQTLRAMIDWSYNLLSEEERKALQWLSVFMGGWTLEGAEAVCENPYVLDLLTDLVDKSLVSVDLEHGHEPRYYLLETIRQYAREKLAESGEGEQAHVRHLDYFLKLAQRAEPELYGAGQIEWSQKLEEDHENMRAALEWSFEGNVEAGQQLAAALWWFWDISGRISDGYEWLNKMLAASAKDATLIRGKLLAEASWFAGLLGYAGLKKELAEESVALYQRLGDRVGIAIPFITLGSIANQEADYDRATRLLKESLNLFNYAGNHWGVGFVLGRLGNTAEIQGDFEQAQKLYEESLQIFNKTGDKENIAWTLYLMGGLAGQVGDDQRAVKLYEEALQIEKIVKSKPVTAWILHNLGVTLLQQGDYERSRLLFEEALEINQKMGTRTGVSNELNALGWCTRLQGDYPKARSLYCEGLQLIKHSDNDKFIADYLVDVGVLLAGQGRLEKFVRLLGVAQGLFPNTLKTFLPFSRIETEQFIASAYAELGNDVYTAAYEAGKQMALDEAISYVMKELAQ